MNWNPKPLRPEDPNPLFGVDEEFTVKKSLSPIERQRLSDGTPHTKSGPGSLRPSIVPSSDDDPELYIGKSASKDESSAEKSLNPDEVVKSFLAKGDGKAYYNEEDEEEEAKKADAQSMGEKASNAVTGAAKVAGNAVGSATKTAVGLANTK